MEERLITLHISPSDNEWLQRIPEVPTLFVLVFVTWGELGPRTVLEAFMSKYSPEEIARFRRAAARRYRRLGSR